MGSVRKMSQAQMRRYERDQQTPEWLDWLARMDTELERFLSEDAPEVGVLADPWSAEGLRLAGDTAREAFGELPTLNRPEHRAAADRFTRFIGEVYVRTLEGMWCNIPRDKDQTMWPMIEEPYRIIPLDPRIQLGMAFVKPTKRIPLPPEGELARTYVHSRNKYEDWVAAGRLPIDEWI